MASTISTAKCNDPVDFEDIFKSFILHIKQNLNLVEVSANFTSDRTYTQLISSTLPLLAEWSQLDHCIRVVPSNKNDKQSDSFRSQGNPFYGKKLLHEALIEYNKSIQHACFTSNKTVIENEPVERHSTSSPIHEALVGPGSTSLALAYANRSAVLFDLSLFYLAVEDITRCLCLGYPNKKNKLALRKAKCIAHLEVASLCNELVKKYNYVGKDKDLSRELYQSIQIKIEVCMKSFVDVHTTDSEVNNLNEDVQNIVDKFVKSYIANKKKSSDINHGKNVTKATPSLKDLNHHSSTNGTINSILYEKGIPQLVRSSVPTLKKEHSSIKGLSGDLSLVYQPDQGRYLVADQDIYPGTVLAVDPGYGSSGVVLPSHSSSVCASCLTFVLAPLPCPTCSTVVFCSEDCCRVALSSFHGYECCLLATLHALDMGRNSELALRMVTVAGLPKLREMVKSFHGEEEDKRKRMSVATKQGEGAQSDNQVSAIKGDDHAATVAVEATLPNNSANIFTNNNVGLELPEGFDPSGIYDSQDYRSIFNLVGNKKARSVGDIFKRSVMACILVKLLETSGTFFEPNSNWPQSMDSHLSESLSLLNTASPTKSETGHNNLAPEDEHENLDDRILVGSVLLRHIMNLPCNAHSITLYHVSNDNLSSNYSEDVGANAFGVLSLTNHSCSPNCYRQSYGAVGVLRATEFIPKGSEISDCYCAHFAVERRKQRQEKLKMQYLFSCCCRACAEDWHLFDCDCVPICKERYCRGCGEPAKSCLATGCGKFMEEKPVEFRLKCLGKECKGFIRAVTGSCSICEEPYEDIGGLLKFNSNKSFHEQNGCGTQVVSTEDSVLSDATTSPCASTSNATEKFPSKCRSLSPLKTGEVFNGITVSGLIEHIEQRLVEYNTASGAILTAHSLLDEHVSYVEELVYLLTRLVARPNKALLRSQEILKHCYDRQGCYMLLSKQNAKK